LHRGPAALLIAFYGIEYPLAAEIDEGGWRYDVGLNPTIPQAAAGPLMLPPMSVPIPNGTH